MLTAILIIAVMYFSLLYARFEGERYAPGRVEKVIVLTVCGLAFLLLFLLMIGLGDYRGGDVSWLLLVPATIAAYVLLVPVRMMLRIKVHPVESTIIVVTITSALAFALALPYFSYH